MWGAPQGLNFLNSIQKMQQPGGGLSAGAGGAPNFIDNGFIGKLMAGNPGGLLGAIANRSEPAPGQPGAPMEGPIAPGAPAMMARGGLPQVGLLARMKGMMPGMAPGMPGMPQPMMAPPDAGLSGHPIPGDLAGY